MYCVCIYVFMYICLLIRFIGYGDHKVTIFHNPTTYVPFARWNMSSLALRTAHSTTTCCPYPQLRILWFKSIPRCWPFSRDITVKSASAWYIAIIPPPTPLRLYESVMTPANNDRLTVLERFPMLISRRTWLPPRCQTKPRSGRGECVIFHVRAHVTFRLTYS